MSPLRSKTGSIAAEHVAALVVLFLGLTFPLCNLATICYRYGFLSQACHNGCHAATTAATFTAGSSNNAVMDVVPAAVNKLLDAANGIKNRSLEIRIRDTKLADQTVHTGDPGKKLDDAPATDRLYSIECTISADLDPLVTMAGGFVPSVPGLTGPMRCTVSSRGLLETPEGMNL